MKRYSKLSLFILLMVVSFILSSCNIGTSSHSKSFDDDKKIIDESDGYTYMKKQGKMEDGKVDIEFESFSGTDTMYKIVVDKESEVVFDYKTEIEKGDFKVVIITPEDEILEVLNGTGEEREKILLQEGTNRLKFVGRKASGKVEIDIDAGEYVEIKDGESFWD